MAVGAAAPASESSARLEFDGRQRSRSPRGCHVGEEPTAKGTLPNNVVEDEDLVDGFSAAEILGSGENRIGYTFDDLICLPGHIGFGVHEVDIGSRFSKRLRLQVPLVSSPMDTVTESRMAIGMALQGGLGVIHSRMNINDQCAEVTKVKRYEAGMIIGPICIKPATTLAEIDDLKAKFRFSGFPVTSDGRVGSNLLGLVTRRDTDFVRDRSITAESVMTKVEDLVTAQQGVDLPTANGVLRASKKGKLPIITPSGELVALIARADLKKTAEYPLATKDSSGRLKVAAAVGVQPKDQERVKALVAAGVDALVLPHKQGISKLHVEMIKWIKHEFPEVDVVGGNVASQVQAARLIECGVDAIRIGMGTGSSSTRQEVSACGRAQASAVYHVAALASRAGVPVIADGGLGSPGQILKALMMGADVAMCGSLLAGTEESPGEYIFAEGVRLKRYRGMGSVDAISKNGDDVRLPSAITVAHGVSGAVVERGALRDFIPYVSQSLRHGMQDVGCQSIDILHRRLRNGELRFEVRSAAAQREGGIHGLHSYENKLFSSSR